MKFLVIAFLLCCIGSCQKDATPTIYAPAPLEAVTGDSVIAPTSHPGRDFPLYFIDSVTIAKKMYTVMQGHPNSKSTLNLRILYKGDTIYRHGNKASNGFEFEDFDGDGTPEIRLHQLSNVGV